MDEGMHQHSQSQSTDVMRDHSYLIFDKSQTDVVQSVVLVKTKRFTC